MTTIILPILSREEVINMRSSLGFHTMSLMLLVNDEDITELIKDFKKYSQNTRLIKIYVDNGDYHIMYYKEDRGIKWIIRQNDWSYRFGVYIVQVTINPKILGGIQDYVKASTYENMETAITNFNLESKRISPLLKNFYEYKLQRIDYCVNFYLDELINQGSPELIMELIKKSNIPTDYEEYMKYDKTAHRMKSPDDSFYLKNNSVNVNCYNKYADLQQRSEDRKSKGLGGISQVTLDEARGIIRFEVQFKYYKMYHVSKLAKQAGNNEYNLYESLLIPEVCIDIVEDYFIKIIGKGDWYTLQAATKKIKEQHFHKQKENRLIEALQYVNQCRSLAKAKASLEGKELEAFKRTLNDLSALHISPVTIPKDRGVTKIPNLLYAYFDKVQSEKLKWEIEEFSSNCLKEYVKEFGYLPT